MVRALSAEHCFSARLLLPAKLFPFPCELRARIQVPLHQGRVPVLSRFPKQNHAPLKSAAPPQSRTVFLKAFLSPFSLNNSFCNFFYCCCFAPCLFCCCN